MFFWDFLFSEEEETRQSLNILISGIFGKQERSLIFTKTLLRVIKKCIEMLLKRHTEERENDVFQYIQKCNLFKNIIFKKKCIIMYCS